LTFTCKRNRLRELTRGTRGRPLLAPKAKEALDRGLQALSVNKPKEAENTWVKREAGAWASRCAVCWQGVLYLSLQKLGKQAQDVLEKASQMEPSSARFWGHWGWPLLTREIRPRLSLRWRIAAVGGLGGGRRTGHWAKRTTIANNMISAEKRRSWRLTESNGKAPQIELLVAQSLPL